MPEDKFEFATGTDKNTPTSIKDRIMEIVVTAYHTKDGKRDKCEYIEKRCEDCFGGCWAVFIYDSFHGGYFSRYFDKCFISIKYNEGSKDENIIVFKSSQQ